jgi:quinol monooxygenase YgiN|tara:strand:+ start:167 stop:484 length:318 start_codon:yes stop_codon:yes gene_type:complete
MLIHITAKYQVKKEALDKCFIAVQSLVTYVQKNEPKTLFYLANQEVLDPTKFFHIIVFEDEIGLKLHQSSPASAKFVETVYPEALQPLEFQEYNIFASKTENWRA